ncbi:MAG TPA: electron transport complex subunit E [Pseudomonadales bacterium]|nr:electron transport complex subunit E [Pseudomonadales bacterium]
MSTPSAREIAAEGLWRNNPALVQLLGLCPLLAVTGSVVNALGLGIATMLVLVGSNVSVSLVRSFVPADVRLPAFVMIIASFTTVITLLMQAYAFELYQIMALFVQIIVTNCAILGRADAFASRHPLLPAALDGLMMGLGFTAVLVVLGAMRELIGHGTLLAGMELLLGPIARDWTLTIIPDYRGFLLAVLPPGAFLGMGLLIALKSWLDAHIARRRAERAPAAEAVSRRVRVTGDIS